MLERPWSLAQFAVAAVLLVISLIGVIGTLVFDDGSWTFTFAGAIQSFAVFPGLIISLVLNGTLMGLRRAPAPNLAQRILLILEFVGVALLLLFHFFQDEQAYTLGFAIATWPVVIVIAVILAVLAIVQLAKPTAPTAQPVPSP
ncbi:MAG: hypothetical protein AB7K08_00310 [Microbacteriaceae bacterium]